MVNIEINHISLCAGYGGIDLGLRRAIPDLRTIAFSEIEAFACANLVAKMEAGYLDSAPIWTNLKTFDFSKFRGLVGILSGGWPCQPFSQCGLRKGDTDERHLFPYIMQGVDACHPDLLFFENVEGIITTKLQLEGQADPVGTPVLLHVLRELERRGYTATWDLFSAEETGAPHRRNRVFILAYANHARLERYARYADGSSREKCGEARSTAESSVQHRPMAGSAWPSRPGQCQYDWEPPRVSASLEKPDSANRGCSQRSETSASWTASSTGGSSTPVSRNAAELGYTESDEQRRPRLAEQCARGDGQSSGNAGVSVPEPNRAEAEQRSTQSALGGNADGNTGGLDYAELCQSNDNRTDELRLLGNGVVPAVAELAFKTLLSDLMKIYVDEQV